MEIQIEEAGSNLNRHEVQTVKISKEFITPIIAKKYLERNTFNRRISQPILLRYTNDMISGKWKEDTYEPIKISENGRILDGQHRLLAIVKSNCSIYVHVAYNVDESVFDVLDTGKVRNASDCFFVAGVKLANSLPSIMSYYNLLEEGRTNGVQINHRSTNAELLQQYYEDELFWQNIGRISYNLYVSFAKILPSSIIGGFYAHFYKLNPDKAEMFMNQLCTGLDVSNKSIHMLRKKLMQDKMSPRKMLPNLKMALIIKTWNYFINGANMKIIYFDSVREKFPTAIK